jgi:hypothetical protein
MFTITGPDEDGYVWAHVKREDGSTTDLNLGKFEDVCANLTEWLGSVDYLERE